MSAVLLPHSFPHIDSASSSHDHDIPVSQHLWDEALNEPAEQFLSRCGKRIRAALVNESYRAVGGIDEPCKEISEGIELLHAGSLIIDDIEDDSALRRGKPTLHREIGLPLALNTGNWMYFRALEKLSEAPIDRTARQRIVGRTIREVRRCHEGQALDLAAAVDLLDPREIHRTARAISRLKTGGLTALAAWIGAIAAGGDRVTTKAISRFGMNVGVCLQMHNDLNELHHFVEGEQRFDDLRNARVTWPWVWAQKVISETEFMVLRGRLSRSLGDSQELRSIACKLIDLVADRGQTYIQKRLERELTLLGEHVDSTRGLRSVLGNLRRKRGESCR